MRKSLPGLSKTVCPSLCLLYHLCNDSLHEFKGLKVFLSPSPVDGKIMGQSKLETNLLKSIKDPRFICLYLIMVNDGYYWFIMLNDG